MDHRQAPWGCSPVLRVEGQRSHELSLRGEDPHVVRHEGDHSSAAVSPADSDVVEGAAVAKVILPR